MMSHWVYNHTWDRAYSQQRQKKKKNSVLFLEGFYSCNNVLPEIFFFFSLLKDTPWLPILFFYGISLCASVYISATVYISCAVSLDLFFCLFLLSYSSLFVLILLI